MSCKAVTVLRLVMPAVLLATMHRTAGTLG